MSCMGAASKELVSAVREFNRFYTREIGVLDEGILRSPFSLTEVRIFFELAHRERATATELARELGIDPGYLSRILSGFETNGLVTRRTSEFDGRQSVIELTPSGAAAFSPLDERQSREVEEMLDRLSPGERTRLATAMQAIQEVLGSRSEAGQSYVLRPP